MIRLLLHPRWLSAATPARLDRFRRTITAPRSDDDPAEAAAHGVIVIAALCDDAAIRGTNRVRGALCAI